MGICCSLCCSLFLKYTDYSIMVTDDILENIQQQLQLILLDKLFTGLDYWSVSFKYNNILKKYLTLKISNVLQNLKFPVLTVNSKFTKHLSENISYVIIKLIVDETYLNILNEKKYVSLNISYDLPFYNIESTRVLTNNKEIYFIKNKVSTIINENNDIETVSLNSTNSIHKEIFNNNLEKIVLQAIDKISNNKLEEIIVTIYENIKKYEIRKKEFVKKNR
jgi:hypothetical protein